jgi:alpha-D-ribose 1-methylphosphonate 5-triphosphate diphosphatase
MAMLHAVFKLFDLNLGTLPDLVRLVSLNPAMAVGLDNELGSLEVGKLADVIVVDTTTDVPRLSRVFVGGKEMMSIRTE